MSELTQQLTTALPQGKEPGPEWAKALRDNAAGQFRAFGLPTRRDEAWKYTGLRALEQAGIQLVDQVGVPVPPAIQAKSMLDSAHRVDMVDGQFASQHGQLPDGVTVLSLADALEQDIDRAVDVLLESHSVPVTVGRIVAERMPG